MIKAWKSQKADVIAFERESSWQIYGTPRAGVLELIQKMGGNDETPTSQEPFAGFTRLGKGGSRLERLAGVPGSSPSVDVATVADSHVQNEEHLVVNLLDDPVVSGADSPLSVTAH